MRKNKRPPRVQKKVRNIAVRRNTKVFGSLTHYIAKNVIALSAIILSILTSLVIYYLTSSEPDIRAFGEYKIVTLDEKVDENLNLVMYMSFKRGYKNLSVKSGFVDKVEFVPLSVGIFPQLTVTSVDKVALRWRDEREIEVRFMITLPLEIKRKYAHEDKDIAFEIKPYDNTGKLIERDVHGTYFKEVVGATMDEERGGRAPSPQK